MPALLIRTSTLLNSSIARSMSFCACSASETSACTAMASPPALRDLLHQLLGRLLARGVVDDDLGPPTGQLLRNSRAQPPARTRDHNNGFIQSTHTTLPFLFASKVESIDTRNPTQTKYQKHLSPSTTTPKCYREQQASKRSPESVAQASNRNPKMLKASSPKGQSVADKRQPSDWNALTRGPVMHLYMQFWRTPQSADSAHPRLRNNA